MYKQIIITRKDLNMTPGKLAGQVSHASMAFLTNMIRSNAEYLVRGGVYQSKLILERDLFEEWIDGIFTKVVLGAKNRNQLMKAIELAEKLGMEEGKDFFLIKDCCKTELEPEEIDENGVGRTLTCIGFRPIDSEVIDQIGKKYQLFK